MNDVQKDRLIDNSDYYCNITVNDDVFDVLLKYNQYHISGTTDKIIYMCNNVFEQELLDSLVIDDINLLSRYNDWFKITKK